MQSYTKVQNPELHEGSKSKATQGPKIQSYTKAENPKLHKGPKSRATQRPKIQNCSKAPKSRAARRLKMQSYSKVAPPMDHAGGDRVSGHGSLRKANRSESPFLQTRV